ncbi:Magnesium transporter CorA-like family protein [Zostera marina]|uniref:Magnesium transporter CorA-like family protein n=1 Tax=Zostera marina TaxID=29655 RepID=A0A0K9PW69_ZOSMR|nr:Magnesium transporter CorA-like family protein [Zostera marina]
MLQTLNMDNIKEISKETIKDPNSDLWTNGLICAFEFIRGKNLHRYGSNTHLETERDRRDNQTHTAKYSSELDVNPSFISVEDDSKNISFDHWVPIGWARISDLVQQIKIGESSISQCMDDFIEGGDLDITVADVAIPYWERPEGPTWWCHVEANHPLVISWFSEAQWLHPAISVALIDESRLISERMKYLFYEVPVRVAGGILFELLGQSVGDPFCNEDDIPIVLRSWQAQNFLVSSLHIKGDATNINVLGITEVQELLSAGGNATPKSIHQVIAHLAYYLSRWDDRLFRKYVFGAADEVELKFVNRRNYEDVSLLSVILNSEIEKLATQVIRVKWSLHAREEIISALLLHLKGSNARKMLEVVKKNAREMLEEQEAVRARLFTIQDVMQNTVRAWLQDKSLRVTHNLAIFGGCGLILSTITGLFGVNLDGIPGSIGTPYAFALFTGILLIIGLILIGFGLLFLGLQKPLNSSKVRIRKLELDNLVSRFQHDAETHAKVRLPQTNNIMQDPNCIFID